MPESESSLTADQILNRTLYDMGFFRPHGKSSALKLTGLVNLPPREAVYSPVLSNEPLLVLDYTDASVNILDPAFGRMGRQAVVDTLLAIAGAHRDPMVDDLNEIVREEQRQMTLARFALRDSLVL